MGKGSFSVRCLVAVAGLMLAGAWCPASAQSQTLEPVFIARSEVSGLIHTKPETILELLPRPIPDRFTEGEVREFERRVRNLAIFDSVQVSVVDQVLVVVVREKFTLAPIVNFSTGKTNQDVDVTAGAGEYNLFGEATKLSGVFRYTQRRPNFELALAQHSFHPIRWAKEASLFINSSGFRFQDQTKAWHRDRLGGEFEMKSPYRYGSALRYEVVFRGYREYMTDATAGSPPSGVFLGIAPEAIWDKYHWHDLVPRGYRLILEVRPGYFFGPNQNRHEGRVRYLQGVPLSLIGENTVLMLNGVAEAVNSGNVNHSLLIGSQVGVRGLADNLYRNRAQTYLNTEVRHAVPIGPRWALQSVVFSDLGLFQGMNPDGNVRGWTGAANVGGGIRIIPTWLSTTLLRVDVARLLAPSEAWLVQTAIAQYF
jgi:hypothetical protein